MTYDQEIKESKVVLVEFFATWCPHCQKMAPIVEQVKENLSGKASVVQLDIDKNQETADANDVQSVPTFIVYVNGEEQWRYSGEIAGASLLSKVESYI